MALLFDTLTGVPALDAQNVAEVQQLLDSDQGQVVSNEDEEEEDLFQCGKCKQQFSSLNSFVAHKNENCRKNQVAEGEKCSTEAATVSTSTATTLVNHDLSGTLTTSGHLLIEPVSPSMGSNVIHLSESDILSLTGGMHSSATGLHITDQSGTLNTGTLSLITSTASDNGLLTSSSTTTTHAILHGSGNNGTAIGFPVSFLTNSGLLTGHSSLPLLVTTSANSSGNGDISNEVASVTISPNIVLNMITSSTALTAGNIHQTSNGHLQAIVPKTPVKASITPKKLDSAINVLPSPTMKIASAKAAANKKRQKQSLEELEEALSADDEKEGEQKKVPKLKCNYCERAFCKNFDLQQHVRCHTGEKPFQCVVCGRAFAQKSNVKKHMQTHKVWPDGLAHTLPNSGDDEEMNESHEALDEFLEEQQIDQDGENKSVDNSYACPYCAYTGKTYFELKSHMKSHKREKVYKCIQIPCGKMFAELEPYLEHMQSHENEMTYRCHQCSKAFSTLNDLGVHQYTHSMYPSQGSRSGQKYYRCQKCLNKYTTPAALEHHLATSTHHYPCTHCNKIFPCERYLRRHLLTHGTGLHICHFCDKTFKTANYLKVHAVIHTGEKPYGCNICNAAFNRRDKLKRHKLVHDPIKRFKCPFRAHTGCPKEFNRPDKLKAHILTHSGIKPHQCTQCGRSFSRRAHLRAHMNGHAASQQQQQHLTETTEQQQDRTEGDDTSPEKEVVANQIPTIETVSDLQGGMQKDSSGFITLFDCQSCGSLFTSEVDLGRHSCTGAENMESMSGKKTSKSPVGKKTVNNGNSVKSKLPKSKPTLTTATLGDSICSAKDSSGDLTYLTDQLTDLPSSQIEIITSSCTDFSSNFSSIVIDGISIHPTIPVNLLSSVDDDDDGDDGSKEIETLPNAKNVLSSANDPNFRSETNE